MIGGWPEVEAEDLASDWRTGSAVTAQPAQPAQPWEYQEVTLPGHGREDGEGRSGEAGGSLAGLLDDFDAAGWALAGVRWTQGASASLEPARLIFKR